jgi:hypothetical protein
MERIRHHNKPAKRGSPKLTDQARRALITEATKRPKITLKEQQSSTAEIGVSVHRTTLKPYTPTEPGFTEEWPEKKALLKEKNPIENLWYDLKISVHQRNPSNLKELEQFCLEEWAKFPVAICAKLIDTYPKILAAVIAAKGGSTKY